MNEPKNESTRTESELSDEELDQVSGGTLLSSPLAQKLRDVTINNNSTREIIEDAYGY